MSCLLGIKAKKPVLLIKWGHTVDLPPNEEISDGPAAKLTYLCPSQKPRLLLYFFEQVSPKTLSGLSLLSCSNETAAQTGSCTKTSVETHLI